MGDEGASPPWLRDGLRAAWHELRGYLATTWQMTRSPAQFMDAWHAGTADAINPLAMLATGAALVAAAHQLAGAVIPGLAHPDGLVDAVLSALGPYAHYVAIGLLCHAVMAPGGRGNVRVLDTVAAALFAGAGPAALAEVVGWLVLCAIFPATQSVIATSVMLGLAFTLFCFSLASALGGLHKTAWWRVLLAFAIAFPVTGVVFGVLKPPGNYGLHWVVNLDGGPPLMLGI